MPIPWLIRKALPNACALVDIIKIDSDMLPSMFLEQTYVSRNGFEIDDGKFTSQSLCKRTQTDRPLLEEALLFIDEMAQTIKINNPFKLHRSLILNGQDGAWAVLLNTIGFKAFIRLLMEHQIITRIESCYVQVTGDPIKSISNSYESIKNFKFNNRDIFIERQQIFHAFKQSAIGLPCKNQLAKAKSQPSSVAIIKALIESIFYDKRVSIKYPVRKATPSSSTYRKLFSYVKGLVNRNKKCPYRRLFNYHCPITTTPSFHDQDIYSQSDENFNFSPAEKLYETSFLSCVQPVNKVNAYIMAVILRILVPNYNHSNKNNKVPRVIGHLLKKIRLFIELRQQECIILSDVLEGLSLTELWTMISESSDKVPSRSPGENCIRSERVKSFILWIFNGLIIPLIKNSFYVTETSSQSKRIVYVRHEDWKYLTNPHWKNVLKCNFELALNINTSEIWEKLSIYRARMIPKENGTMRTILTRIDPKDKNNNQKNSRSKLSEIQQIKKLQAILELCKVQEPSLSGSQVASFDAVLDNLLDFKNRTFNHNHQVNPKIYFCKMDVENCFDSIPHEKLCRVINEILKSVLEQHENENSDSNQSSNLEGYFEIRRFCLASSISSRLCKRYKYVAFMLNKNSTSQGVTMKDANGGSVVFEEQAIHKALINAKLMIIKDVGSSEYFDRRKLMAILNEHLRNSFIHFRKDFHETPTSRESDQIKHTDIMPNFEVKGDQPTGKKKKSKKDSPVLYRKCLGIPQGSIISSILCNFFFGHMEKHKLLRFMKNSQSQLIRWTDDILFMTTSKTIMNDFMDTLCSGFPEYGLRINTEKILVNFITDSNTKCLLDKGVGFPWCGIIINQSNLEVGWDYTRFFGIPIKDCISMDRRSTLDEMAKMFLKPRLLRILFDHRLAEDWKIATKNMYEVIILLAIKMHVLVREMECTYRHQLVKDERLIKMVHNVASYMTAAVRKKTLDPVFHGTEIIFSIVWGAFFRVWRLRPYRYRKIIGSPDMVKLEKQCDWWIQRSKVNLHRTVHEMLTRLIY